MGVMERTTRGAPCIFCGDVGYDIRVHYPEQEKTVHWCHKTCRNGVCKGDIVIAGGEEYICIASQKVHKIGVFDLFEKKLSKEAWMERQRRTNPDWVEKGYARGNPSMKAKTTAKAMSFKAPTGDELMPGEVKPLPNKQLDKIYRAMLDMMVLEKKHKEQLLEEWSSPIHDVSHLLKDYPIRSMPPDDKVRFFGKERFENPSKKAIVYRLLSLFGDLRGVPGFYMRSGPYYEGKPESERWTFVGPEGIIFPCYDGEGHLYRIRIKDDYPNMKLTEGKGGPYEGKYGRFYHKYNERGEHCWYFKPRKEFDEKEEPTSELVYGMGVNKITLNQKGIPMFGKPEGKYKNFSSLKSKYVDNQTINTMLNGSGSGTPYSVYDKHAVSYKVVLGTEGEKKGMVGCAIKHVPVAEVAGVDCYTDLFKQDESGLSCIDRMKQKGMEIFVLCYDADKEDNERVRRAESDFVKELKEHGVRPRIGYWKKEFDKGLDDILLAGLDIMIEPE